MNEKKCMCADPGLLIFPCSGGSDVGELADRVARKMSKCSAARMFCLAGIGANVSGMIESAKAASRLVAIDGCQVFCSKKILENAGFKPSAFNLKDLGFVKGKTEVNAENIDRAVSQISGGKSEKNTGNHSNNCCGT